MPKPVRTFVAIESTPSVRDRACDVINKLSATSASVRWVEPNQMHWTLAFLGDVPMDDIPGVCRAVQRGAESVAPFTLHAQGTGAFPNVERPRTIWLGATQGSDELIALHDAIEVELEKLGFRGERRRYRPHLTLGRVRRSAPHEVSQLGELVEQYANFDAGSMHIDEGPSSSPVGSLQADRATTSWVAHFWRRLEQTRVECDTIPPEAENLFWSHVR